ncbi:MAG TPA: hypothetical protein DF383_10090 [Deltaproteobacteria bacterium]|nr:hypothetical protein [Deltaproteobacteria bacterium]
MAWAFSLAVSKKSGAAAQSDFVLFLVFSAAQAVAAYALSRYYFNLDWQTALAYPAGAVLALGAFFVLSCGFSSAFTSILLGVLLAGGFALSLRLGEVFGGLLYSLALLGSALLVKKILASDSAAERLWQRLIFFVALLAAGRAAIQYYLLQSNYANLGVVVTHPYTYLALVAGVFLPALLWINERDRLMPTALALVLFGILLPLVLGVFVHVRPMGGYLLGLVTVSFLFGVIFAETYSMGILTYLNLAAVVLALPLFAKLTILSRVTRLEILGGLALLLLLGYVTSRAVSSGGGNAESASM